MKRLIVFLMLGTLPFAACKKKQEDVLADIKKNTATINEKLKDWSKRHIDDLTSRGNGNITGYFRDEEIKKIESQHFGEKDRTFTEYYFDDGMLIYIMEQKYVYNAPISYTEELALSNNNDSNWYDDAKTKLQVSRFYFHKNKLVKWIDGARDGEDVAVNDADFMAREQSMWAETIIKLKQLKEDDPH